MVQSQSCVRHMTPTATRFLRSGFWGISRAVWKNLQNSFLAFYLLQIGTACSSSSWTLYLNRKIILCVRMFMFHRVVGLLVPKLFLYPELECPKGFSDGWPKFARINLKQNLIHIIKGATGKYTFQSLPPLPPPLFVSNTDPVIKESTLSFSPLHIDGQ